MSIHISPEDDRSRAFRYTVVRIVSKGAVLLIAFFALEKYGLIEAIAALLVSLLFNYIFDFFAQKFWVFGNPIVWSKKILKEFLLYMLFRESVAGLVLGYIFLLNWIFGLSLLIAGAIVGCLFFVVSFFFLRWFFTWETDSVQTWLKKWRIE